MATDVLDRPLGLTKIFGSISKIEDQEDGSIKVFGIASSESRDGAGEIVAAEAMRGALPDYSRFPALREMHQPLAAGKVLEAEVDDDGVTHIVAHVVDPIAIVKVRTGVYAGFSIGGKVLARDPNDRTIITKLRLIEISLVDSPCNPDAVLSMWKADNMTEFKPKSEDVIARAKKLAKAAGHGNRFKDHLFDASQELVAEHLIEKGELEPPPAESETIEAAALTDELPAAEAAASEAPAAEETSAVVEEPAAEAPAAEAIAQPGEEPAPATAEPEPDEGEHGGESAAENDEIEAAAQPDPAAALTDAISKADEAIEAAAAPALAEEPASPFADAAKAAAALRSVTLPDGEPISKSMWEVGRFADLLDSLACVQRCLAWEAESEADQSPIPQELASAIADLGNLLVRMAQEEMAELVASLKRPEGCEVVEIIYAGDGIELAEQIVDLVKADETLIAAAEERLAKAAPPPAPAAEADPRIAELENENERLSKALETAAPAVEELTTKFTGTIDTLKSEIAELRKRFEDEPLPPKTAGTARAVSKANDSAGGDSEEPNGASVLSKEQVAEAWSKLSDQEKGELLIRVSLANPGQIRLPLSNAA